MSGGRASIFSLPDWFDRENWLLTVTRLATSHVVRELPMGSKGDLLFYVLRATKKENIKNWLQKAAFRQVNQAAPKLHRHVAHCLCALSVVD